MQSGFVSGSRCGLIRKEKGCNNMDFGTNPALRLAVQGVRIRTLEKRDRPRQKAVTDLILFNLCPRSARFFSEGRYPSHTPPAVFGRFLIRTIKHYHGRSLATQLLGDYHW